MPKTLASQFDLTETEEKIFALLQDGEVHSRDDLLGCLREKYQTDEDGNKQFNTLQSHLMRIRKKISVRGLQLDCILRYRRINYRISRRLRSSNNGD